MHKVPPIKYAFIYILQYSEEVKDQLCFSLFIIIYLNISNSRSSYFLFSILKKGSIPPTSTHPG